MLHCFIEGQDDETFFKHILLQSDEVDFYQFSQKTVMQVNRYLKTLKQIGEPYLFFADSDGNSPNIKKNKLIQKYSELDMGNIYVVQYEIESWLLAGINKEFGDRHKFKAYYPNTNLVTKEMFLKCTSMCVETKLMLMLEILSEYNYFLATERNDTFEIFFRFNHSLCR